MRCCFTTWFTFRLLELFTTVKNQSLSYGWVQCAWHLEFLRGANSVFFLTSCWAKLFVVFITKIMSAGPPASNSLFPKGQVLVVCMWAGKMHWWHFKRINANHQLLKSEVLGSIKTLLLFFPPQINKPQRIREFRASYILHSIHVSFNDSEMQLSQIFTK